MRNRRKRLLPLLSALLVEWAAGAGGARVVVAGGRAAVDGGVRAAVAGEWGAGDAVARAAVGGEWGAVDAVARAAVAGEWGAVDGGVRAAVAGEWGASAGGARTGGAGGWATGDGGAGVATAAGLPPAPRNLTARAVASDAVVLGWVGRLAAGGEFRVEQAALGGSFVEIGRSAAASFTVSGLAPATGYVFRVRSSGPHGDSPYSNEATVATLGLVGPCVADGHTLCLHGGRFRAGASWATATGSGAASAAPWSADDSGLLWFFQADNWELLVKVIDGCALDRSFWVFFAATSDVQYSVTVSDTQTGATRVYFHPAGSVAMPTTDTGALAVCP
jgi:hypothetical protein